MTRPPPALALLVAFLFLGGLASAQVLRAGTLRISVAPVGRLLVVSGVSLADLEGVQARPAVISRLSGMIQARYQDSADFLLLVANRRTVPASTRISGYHYRVRNGVGGIGVPVFGAGPPFGRRLQGALYFPRWASFWRAPLLHELAHQWANDALTTSEPGHFGFCSAGRQLGGFEDASLRALGGSTYQASTWGGRPFGTAANGGNSVPYSDLELYLMGLRPARQVAPWRCAVQPRWLDQARGLFSAQRIRAQSVQDVIRQHGPRQPEYGVSPTVFTLLAVLISEQPPTPADLRGAWANLSRITERDNGDSTYTFYEATRGVGRLELVRPVLR